MTEGESERGREMMCVQWSEESECECDGEIEREVRNIYERIKLKRTLEIKAERESTK